MSRTVTLQEPSPEQARIHRVRETIHRDGATPGGALDGLAVIVKDDTWRRVAGPDGQPFASFRAFVEAKPPFGLGIDENELRKIISLRHPHEGSARIAKRMVAMRDQVERLLREEIKELGRPRVHTGASSRATRTAGESDTADYVVARLKRDDPTLAEQVVRGEITANAAARAAGIRRPRIVLSTPERIAKSLRKHLDEATLRHLADLLRGG